MNDIQYKEMLNNMDKLYKKLDLAEERLSKLEKELDENPASEETLFSLVQEHFNQRT